MNIFKTLTSTLAIAALALSFSSCSDDDDKASGAVGSMSGDYSLFAWSSAQSKEKPDYAVDEEKGVKVKKLAEDAVEISFNGGNEVYKIEGIAKSDEQDPILSGLGGTMYESVNVTVVKSEIIDAESATGEAYFDYIEQFKGCTLNFEVKDENGSLIEFMVVQNALKAIIKLIS